jgi:malonyl-CoA/methylmalonyl-CoA synthetase
MAEVADLTLFTRARTHGDRTAIVDSLGTHAYRDLLAASSRVALSLIGALGPLVGQRVAYLVAPGFEHVAVQWGIWMAGAIGVPLSPAQAPPEWAYVVGDTEAVAVAVDASFAGQVRTAVEGERLRVLSVPALLAGGEDGAALPSPGPDSPALILYTSGTTGKPKGVVLTHANIEAQVECLVRAWEWQPSDRVLHILPLHHVHGIVNVLTCALWSGATCEVLPRFDAEATWSVFAAGRLTLFMAVPTIYTKLIAAWEVMPADGRRDGSAACRRMRLMVSGSAALPVSVLERWRQITGHVLLERYGMTEIGMALSNPLHGERRPGFVGAPLPDVDVRIVDELGDRVAAGTPGELEVRGHGVFRHYWRRPEATAAAFHDGWFRTGDVAVLEAGVYRLLGRQSVDIIKSGGFKISALEIEEVLRDHVAIRECAVVGLDDPEWGERVAVAAVLRAGDRLGLEELRDWARARLARYKLPSRLEIVAELPRNAMGKVSKGEVKRLLGGGQQPPHSTSKVESSKS